MTGGLEKRIARLRSRKARLESANFWKSLVSFGLWNNSEAIRVVMEQIAKEESRLLAQQETRKTVEAITRRKRILTKKTGSLSTEGNAGEQSRLIGSYSLHDGEDYPENWAELAKQVRQRDGGCYEKDSFCSGALQVHHIIPLSQGGSNDENNLVTLCEYHHSLKHPHLRGKR